MFTPLKVGKSQLLSLAIHIGRGRLENSIKMRFGFTPRISDELWSFFLFIIFFSDKNKWAIVVSLCSYDYLR